MAGRAWSPPIRRPAHTGCQPSPRVITQNIADGRDTPYGNGSRCSRTVVGLSAASPKVAAWARPVARPAGSASAIRPPPSGPPPCHPGVPTARLSAASSAPARNPPGGFRSHLRRDNLAWHHRDTRGRTTAGVAATRPSSDCRGVTKSSGPEAAYPHPSNVSSPYPGGGRCGSRDQTPDDSKGTYDGWTRRS